MTLYTVILGVGIGTGIWLLATRRRGARSNGRALRW